MLADYLEDCVPALRPTPSYGEGLYAEHPGTDVGRVIRCLAARTEVASLAVAFYAGAWSGGFSAALGLRDRARRAGLAGNGTAVPKLASAEGSVPKCNEALETLREQDLLDVVDLRCQMVCDTEDQKKCASEVEALFCPRGRLDFLAMDIDRLTSSAFVRSLLEGPCSPRVLLVENSGLRWWLYKLLYGPLEFPDAFGKWHVYEESVLHAPASRGLGLWRLAVDRQLSGMAADPFIDPDPVRRFSVYVSVA